MWPASLVAELVKSEHLKIIASLRINDKPNKYVQSVEELLGIGTLKDDGVGVFALPGASKDFIEFWKKFSHEFHQDQTTKQQLANSYFDKFDRGEDITQILKLHSDAIDLTAREEEVATLIKKKGLTNKQISDQLGVSESAVKLHVTNILKKYNLQSRTQLAVN
jgi:DNA-binding CsgD family transcriptional regulator